MLKYLFYFTQLGVFASFGLSGIIPAIHYGIMEGWFNKISQASLGWLILMGKHILAFCRLYFLLTAISLVTLALTNVSENEIRIWKPHPNGRLRM